MRRFRRLRPSPAMAVACLALAVALSGTGYAVTSLPRNSVGPAQLKANAVNGAKVKNGSLGKVDFGRNQLPAGPKGTPGAPGAQGPIGPQGTAGTAGGKGPTGAKGASGVKGATGAAGAPNPNAVNSDLLDNLNSTDFARSRIYVLEKITDGSANGGGTCPDGDICSAGGYYCDTGDTLLTGGFAEIDPGTRLVASEPFTPNPQDTWRIKFVNNSTEDTVTVYTVCADNGATHT